MSDELTFDEQQRQRRVNDAKEKLARVEEERDILLGTINALLAHCGHRLTREVYCCGKPEGSACLVCGKRWD